MAMKYAHFKKSVSNNNTNVEYYTEMEGDGPVPKRITSANPGFMSGTGFIAGFTSSKSHFVFSGSREGIDNSVANLWEMNKNLVPCGNATSDTEERNLSEHEGSKGDATARWTSKGQVSKRLGCDGDVKCTITTTEYFLSTGAKGDVLKPLDGDEIKSLGKKKNTLFKSRNKDCINSTSHEVPKPISPFKYNTSVDKNKQIPCPGTDTDFRGVMSHLVNMCPVNPCELEDKKEIKYNTIHNSNVAIVPASSKTIDSKGTETSSCPHKNCDKPEAFSQGTDISTKEEDILISNETNGLKRGVQKSTFSYDGDCFTNADSLQSKSTNVIQEKEHDVESEERELLDLYIFEIERKLAWKQSLQEGNKNVENLRPEYAYFTKLDSSLKKNTGFIRKLKIFSSNQLESLLKDVSQFNLTKYLSEAAAAIVQANLKISDVTSAVELCNAIHHMYAEFSSYLLESFNRYLSFKDEDGMVNYRKFNVDLKFYAELVSVGILEHDEAFPVIISVLAKAVNADREEHNHVNVILNFYRHCKEGYAVPKKMRNLAEKYEVKLPKCNLLLEKEILHINTLLKDYYSSLLNHMLNVHHEVKVFEHQNKKILQSRGELSADRKDKWNVLKLLHERLQYGMRNLAEELGEAMPSVCGGNNESNEVDVIDMTGEEDGSQGLIWEDEEERHFYESLTEMKDFVPSACKALLPVTTVNDDGLDTETEESEEDSTIEIKESDNGNTEEVVVDSNVINNKHAMDTFLSLLPHCMNCESVDQLAVEFLISLNSRCNRRKLSQALIGVHRTRLDLLPFYSRLIATLHPYIPEISSSVVQHLRQEFKYHIRKKDQINIESKLKVVRFIGELVKFRIYPTTDALYCLKLLLRDFSHHNIEMCCTLLESCGRFLFRHTNTHKRTKIYLEQMMRKKSVTALDSRYVTMVENAFYYVDPPEMISVEKKEQPLLHQFIQKLLYQELSKSNVEYVLQLISKLDWENPELAEFCIERLIMAHNVKYNNIGCLASIVSGLACEEKEESVSVMVVDGVMEDIRLGMETNLRKYNQRRIAMVKYMGELYKYRAAESTDVFQVLYSLISFGVTLSYTNPSCLDPPDNLFRIRLVCVLLETCGQYFNSGNTIKKLDYYLIYFQRYFWFKFEDKYWDSIENSFPVGIQYMFQDTILNLRPKMTVYKSFHEASQAVFQMQMVVTSKLVDDTCPKDEFSPSMKFELGAIVEENELSTGCEDSKMEYMDLKQTFKENEDPCLHEYEGTDETSALSPPWQEFAKTRNVEDESFLSAFDKMVTDNIYNRMSEMVKPQYVDIPVPMRSSEKKSYEQIRQKKTEEKSVNFMLLIRKGHKQQYKCLNVPMDSELAVKLRTGKEAEQAEKEYLKLLTLGMSQRQEEESYQEMLAAININRERRIKYHHPRGAPDADLIFGPKRVK